MQCPSRSTGGARTSWRRLRALPTAAAGGSPSRRDRSPRRAASRREWGSWRGGSTVSDAWRSTTGRSTRRSRSARKCGSPLAARRGGTPRGGPVASERQRVAPCGASAGGLPPTPGSAVLAHAASRQGGRGSGARRHRTSAGCRHWGWRAAKRLGRPFSGTLLSGRRPLALPPAGTHPVLGGKFGARGAGSHCLEGCRAQRGRPAWGSSWRASSLSRVRPSCDGSVGTSDQTKFDIYIYIYSSREMLLCIYP